jgi:L-ascorbate metabolism protein UlaG (beta-lactamase superfamily)
MSLFMTAMAQRPPGRRFRSLGRRSRWLIAAGLVVMVAVGAIVSCAPFGGRATGVRLERMRRSPQWQGSHFENQQPIVNDTWASVVSLFKRDTNVVPKSPPSTVSVEPARFAKPPPSGLRVTWLGHSTILLEIDGHRFLTDPVWSERAGPVQFTGPKRWFPPLIALQDLPPLDAVVLTHDHYDHLDYATISALKDRDLTFVAPLGVGAHLERWGVAPNRIVELDWWDSHTFGDLALWAVPARHASGRVLLVDDGAKLWAGYAFLGARHRAYYSGDTGLFPGLRTIGERLGPFDLTMIEIGQYDQAWPDWHLGPEQALEAHRRVGGAVMLPVHWGLFALASHGWTEPIERAVAAARDENAVLITPRPGQSVEPTAERPQERWWPQLHWRTRAEYPIVAHHAD